VPPGATEFTICHYVQAAGALLLNNMADGVILNGTQRAGINLTVGKFHPRFFNGVRA